MGLSILIGALKRRTTVLLTWMILLVQHPMPVHNIRPSSPPVAIYFLFYLTKSILSRPDRMPWNRPKLWDRIAAQHNYGALHFYPMSSHPCTDSIAIINPLTFVLSQHAPVAPNANSQSTMVENGRFVFGSKTGLC